MRVLRCDRQTAAPQLRPAISRGGRYTLDNVVPACRSCNTSKCNDEVTSWLRRKRLDERSFLLRYLEIRSTLGRSVPCAAVEKVPTPTP